MRTIRRSDYDARIEIMPLIDVIFLLLTFFIYALVLMVRVDLLPVPLETYISGDPADPVPASTITLGLDGTLSFNDEKIEADQVINRINSAKQDEPNTRFYLVMAAGEGEVDRGPVLTSLWDRLRDAGVEINLVGAPIVPEGSGQ